MSPRIISQQHGVKPALSVPVVDSLATALRLLDHFSIRDPELSLRELVERTGLYKSRIHRLCGTLVALRFLTRTPSSGYRLGPKLMALGKLYEKSNSLISISRPIMKDLAMVSGESAALFRLDGGACICLARENGSSRLVFDIQEGAHMELHASAAGRILLAYGPKILADQVLAQPELTRLTPDTLTDRGMLAKRLVEIRKRGYEINRGEQELEVAAIGAPIWNHDRAVEATLTVVGPIQRFSGDHEAKLIALLLDASRKISEVLGASL